MDLLFARSLQPALVLVVAIAALVLVAIGLALAGAFDGAGADDLLVGPFRWEPLVTSKLV